MNKTSLIWRPWQQYCKWSKLEVGAVHKAYLSCLTTTESRNTSCPFDFGMIQIFSLLVTVLTIKVIHGRSTLYIKGACGPTTWIHHQRQTSWHLKNYSLIPRLSPLQTILGGLGMRIQRHLHWIACFSTVSALVVWTSRLPSDSSSGSFSFSQRIYRFDSQTRYANNVRTGLRCAHRRPAATELETGIQAISELRPE